jgi:hypothetical protein
MLVQKSLLLAHAQLALSTTYLHEASIPALPVTMHLPRLTLLRTHNASLLEVEKPFGKGVIDIDINGLVIILIL